MMYWAALAICAWTVVLASPVSGCTRGLAPFRAGFHLSVSTPKDLVLLPWYSFNCRGSVFNWGAYFPHQTNPADQNKTYTINFQVWRPRKGPFLQVCYELIGVNSYTEFQVPSSGRFFSTVPLEEQIQVEPKDIIGISSAQGLLLETISLTNWRSFTNPSTFVCQNFFPVVVNRRPVITAVVSTSPTIQPTSTLVPTLPTATPVPSLTPTSTGALGTGGIAGISVVGIGLVLIIATLLVLIPVAVLWGKKRRRASTAVASPPRTKTRKEVPPIPSQPSLSKHYNYFYATEHVVIDSSSPKTPFSPTNTSPNESTDLGGDNGGDNRGDKGGDKPHEYEDVVRLQGGERSTDTASTIYEVLT